MSDNEQDAAGKQEGFLGRWSRRKAAVRAEEQVEQNEIHPDTSLLKEGAVQQGAMVAEEQEEFAFQGEGQIVIADAEEKPSDAPLTDADMPPIETLTEDSDYTGFMSPEVSEELRKLALRKLFQGCLLYTSPSPRDS